MGTSIVPALRRALRLTLETAAPGVRVIAGPQITDDPSDVILVGVRDPYAFSPPPGIETTQAVATMATTRPRDEVVTVWLTVLVRAGDMDVDALYDRAFEHVAAIEAAVRALGIPFLAIPGAYAAEVGGMECTDDQDDYGAWVSVSFPITVKARI